MAEYIERWKAANVLCNAICGSDRRLCVSTTENCQQKKMLELYKLPAADVVPVVRCRECMYFKPWNQNEYYCSNHKGLHQMVTGDQFCSGGKRLTEK